MHIEFIEITNFRKLLSTRVDLSTKTQCNRRTGAIQATNPRAAHAALVVWRSAPADAASEDRNPSG